MTRPKVVLKVSTRGAKAGDTIEVADAETADALVEMGRAIRVKGGKSEAKSD